MPILLSLLINKKSIKNLIYFWKPNVGLVGQQRPHLHAHHPLLPHRLPPHFRLPRGKALPHPQNRSRHHHRIRHRTHPLPRRSRYLRGTSTPLPIKVKLNEFIVFSVLFPPMIFAQGYTLHKSVLAKNARYIVLFGLVGTFTSFLICWGLIYEANQLSTESLMQIW
jgi:hypothetical protein